MRLAALPSGGGMNPARLLCAKAGAATASVMVATNRTEVRRLGKGMLASD